MDPILMPGVLAGPQPGNRTTAGTAESGRLGEAAREFEGVFLGLLMKAMRGNSSGSGLFKEGSDTQMYREMFDQEIGRTLAKAGGIGLAQMVLRDQARRQAAEGATAGRQPVTAGKEATESGH